MNFYRRFSVWLVPPFAQLDGFSKLSDRLHPLFVIGRLLSAFVTAVSEEAHDEQADADDAGKQMQREHSHCWELEQSQAANRNLHCHERNVRNDNQAVQVKRNPATTPAFQKVSIGYIKRNTEQHQSRTYADVLFPHRRCAEV